MTRNTYAFLLSLLIALPAPAGALEEAMIVFKITGDEASEEHLDLINAEIFMIIDGCGKYQLTNADDLADDLMMSPAESLKFCNEEPGCIADIVSGREVRWILFGDMKQSFDGTKFILRLVLINVKARKAAGEKFGQFERESNLVEDSGNTVRELLGLPLAKPKPKPAPKTAEDQDKPPELKDIDVSPDKKDAKAKAVAVRKPPERPGPLSNPWMWSSAGVGVASLAAGIVLGVLSNQKVDEAKKAVDQPQGMSLVHQAEDLATYANTAFIVGGAALSAALVLLIVDIATDDQPPVTPAVACTGTGCAAVVQFSFW